MNSIDTLKHWKSWLKPYYLFTSQAPYSLATFPTWAFRKCGWNECSIVPPSLVSTYWFHTVKALLPFTKSSTAVVFLTCWTSLRSGCKGHVCCGVYLTPNPRRNVQSFHCALSQSTWYKWWRSSSQCWRNELAAGCWLHRHPLSTLSKITWTVVHACSKLLTVSAFQCACILLPLPGSHMLTKRQVICCQTSLCHWHLILLLFI